VCVCVHTCAVIVMRGLRGCKVCCLTSKRRFLKLLLFVLFFSETGSCYIAQAVLKLSSAGIAPHLAKLGFLKEKGQPSEEPYPSQP
jgi:hypothetical protein